MKIRLAATGKLRLRIVAGSVRFALSAVASAAPPPPVDEPPPPQDATITVTPADVADYRVFQRVGTSKAIAVSGSYTGTPDTIDARLVNADTNEPVTAWASVATAPSGGSFAGTFNAPQGYWYKLQFRGSKAGAASTPVTTANRFGVGIIVWMIGQSNMVNRRGTGIKAPLADKRTVEYWLDAWRLHGYRNASAPLNAEIGDAGYTNTGNGGRGDGYILIANLLAQGLDLPVALLSCADGGSPISEWITTINGSDWTGKAVPVLNATGGDCEIVFWQQGESDADLMSKDTMKTRLGQLMAQCHQQTGRNASTLKFFVTTLGAGSYGSSEGEFGNIRAAHVEFATGTPGAYLATSAQDSLTNDGVHWVGETYNRVVKREARSMLHAYGIGVSGAGPRVTGATRTGLQVRLAIAHSGGTALLDGAGGNGSALTGFQFADAGAAGALIPYTTIIDGNAIVCTLVSAPVGALSVSYAMMNNPHNADPATSTSAVVLASVPYDNVVLHRTSNGCPLQPFSAITVTGA